jgi:hypothetical protein
MLAAAWITAGATGLLALFAVVTAWYARKAFRKQAEEVRILKEQQKDQQNLSAAQTPVLKLQATDLEQSLAERQRDREQRQREQASRVFMLERWGPSSRVIARAKLEQTSPWCRRAPLRCTTPAISQYTG